MKSAWLCILSLLALLALTPTLSSGRSVSEIQPDCDAGECPAGPYCFGFLTANAKTHDGRRDTSPNADPCFNKPSPDSCKGKPWAAVTKVKETAVYRFELIDTNKQGVGIILFEDQPDADPLKTARLVAYCEKGGPEAKVWVNDFNVVGEWAGRKEDGTVPAKKSDDDGVCEFEIDASVDPYKKTQINDKEYRFALFDGVIPPAPEKLTSSDKSLNFLTQLSMATSKPDGPSPSREGGSGAAGVFVRVGGGAVAAAFLGMIAALAA